ncbi:MAG: RnfABCDGE type electron transport complex subunit D [Spirochaetales bacterium]|nr:RnfABCDGE type electron transport complex subunit D [Spirochaetales bacterium]
MKAIKNFLKQMAHNKALGGFGAPFETMYGILFGTSEVTLKAPHIRDNIEIKRFMSCAIIALLPSLAASIYYFGWHMLFLVAVAYVSGGIVEVIFAIVRKREIEEGFLVTGMIFPLVLPPTTPWWVVVIGMVFGVFFGKEVFGGTGRNIFNPALVGRLFITIAFPQMLSSSWQVPLSDVITSATPLSVYKTQGVLQDPLMMLLGNSQIGGGCMGETFRLGIILGGVFLMILKVSNFRTPLFYLGTVALFSFTANLFGISAIAPPWFQLLSGGLLFGAMFMATDPITSPMTNPGKIISAVVMGILTVLIRAFSGYNEGVMFSIILTNALNPIIDSIVLAQKFKVRSK